jgi:hypothetical protein
MTTTLIGAIESLELIGYAIETRPGTFAAPSAYVPGRATITTNQKHAVAMQSRGTVAQVIDGIVGHDTGVQITGELIPEVMSGLIANAFGSGSDSVSGSTAKTHALTPQTALNSLSVEHDIDAVSQIVARRLVGCMVDQINLRATNQAWATLEAQLKGIRETTGATPGLPSNPTPAISTLQPMDYSLMAATYRGSSTTQLQDVTIGIQNNVQAVMGSNGQLYATRMQRTTRRVTLSTTLDFVDSSFYLDWAAGAKLPSGLVITFTSLANIPTTSTPYSIQFTIPGLRPVDAIQLSSASEIINQQIPWSVTVQGANEISAQIVNTETAALA